MRFDRLAGPGQHLRPLPAHDLRRAGLAADVESLDPGPLARALVVDGAPHAFDNALEGRPLERGRLGHGRAGSGAAPGAHEKMGHDPPAPVRDHGRHRGQLQGGHLKLALPDGHGDRLAREPGSLEGLHLPLGTRYESLLLAGDVDACFPAEAQLAGGRRDRLYPHLPAESIKIDVAGVLNGVGQVHEAVPLREPTGARGAVDDHRAVAEDGRFGRDEAEVEARERHDDLEDRAGGIEAADGPVLERRRRVVDELDPLRRREPGDEPVGVEGGRAGHDPDLAGRGIEGNDGAFPVAEELFCLRLQLGVDREDDVPARGRRLARPIPSPLLPPEAVHDLDQRAVLPGQQVVVLPLNSGPAAEVPQPQLPLRVVADLFRRALLEVTEDVSGQGLVGVGPYRLGLDLELGELEAAGLDGSDLLGRQAVLDDDRLEQGQPLEALDAASELLLRDPQQPADQGIDRSGILDVLSDKGDLKAGLVVGEDGPVPVQDEPPGSADDPVPYPVGLGHVPELLVLQDLDLPVVGEGEENEDGDDAEDGVGPADDDREVLVDLVSGHGDAQARRARTRRAT